MALNQQQIEFCESKEPFIRLLAPAGSGKTFSILKRCKRILTDNPSDKILLFTFTRVARDEIRERIRSKEEFKNLRGKVRVETLNQYGFTYIKNIKKGIQVKSSKQDKFFLLNNNLRPIWDKNTRLGRVLGNNRKHYSDIINVFDALKSIGFKHNLSSNELNDHFLEHKEWLFKNGLKRYFESGIDKPLRSFNLIESNDQYKSLINLWSRCTQHLWESAIITLDDQKYWAYQLYKSKYEDTVLPKPNQYRHIIVDEFQDINPLDLLLLKELVRINESTFTIVGDDDQAIYEWRGSTPQFILCPDEYFGEPFHTIRLNINYRSPKNIIDASIRLINHNKNRVEKEIYSNISGNANIEVCQYEHHHAYLEDIRTLCENFDGSGGKKLAIVSRKKSQLIPIQILLTSSDIPFYAKEDLNVMLSKAFEELKQILEIIDEQDSKIRPKQVTEKLMHIIAKVPAWGIKKKEYGQIFKFIVVQKPRTVQKALDCFLEYKGPLNGENSSGEKTIPYYEAVEEVLSSETVAEAIYMIGIHLEGLQRHYLKSDDDIFFKDPPFSFLIEYAENYGDDFYEFIEHVDDAISKMTNVVGEEEYDPEYENKVHIMTALRAKGKEFDTVLLLDVNDGIWPNKLNHSPEELEQERRIFYVAITRARKNLRLYTSNRILSQHVEPSPYLAEMGIQN